MTTKANPTPTTSAEAAAGRTTQALNRRAILTATAAAALSGTSAVAAIVGSDDPIFAVLRAYDPISTKFTDWFRGPYSELERAEYHDGDRRPERRPRVQTGHQDAFTIIQHKPDGDKVDRVERRGVYVYDHEGIDSTCDDLASKQAGDPEALARIEQDRRRWHAELAEQIAQQPQTAVHPVRAEMNRLAELEHDARDALVTTQPTTVAGAAAVLRFLSRNDFGDQFLDDGDDVQQLVLTLAAALEKIAGAANV
jgi:hypothetical protein